MGQSVRARRTQAARAGAPLVRFSELADVNPRVRLDRLSPDTPVSFIPMSDVDEHGRWLGTQTRRLSEVRTGYTAFAEGDVLFAKITPCTENGKGCHATGLTNGIGFGSTEFHVLRPKQGNDASFVFQLSVAPTVRRRAASMMGGSAGQQRVPADFFDVFRVPLLATPEQRAVANLFGSIDTAIERTRAVIWQVRVVKQALLADMMTNGLPGRRVRLTSVRLGEVFAERKEAGHSGLPVVSVTIDNGLVRRGSLDRRVDSDLRPEQHLLARKGDIAYNMMRMWQGVSGIAEEDCIISPAYVVCRPLDGIVPDFAAYFLKHPQTVRMLHRHSQGVADDRLRLYFHHLASIRVKLPPLPIQRDVARMLASVDRRIAASVQHLEQLDKAKRGLLEQLLTGRIPVVKENCK